MTKNNYDKFDEDLIHEKFVEIKRQAYKELKKNGYLRPIGVSKREWLIIKAGLKNGQHLRIKSEKTLVNIPYKLVIF